MNQGKIWLVVKPTVGLPAFLGGVAVIALCVHTAVLTHSDWFPAYFVGGKKAAKAAVVPSTSAPVAGTTVQQPVAAAQPQQAATVLAAVTTAPPDRR